MSEKTPLYEEHVRLGAKLVPFAGYEMPVQYPTGIRAEHEAVRTNAGIFDVSHMGEFRGTGPGSIALVSAVTTNDPAALRIGQAQYSVMCVEDGGIVDDLIVYRQGEDDLLLIVNAANIQKDWAHIGARSGGFEASLADESDDTALIALQGPDSDRLLAPLTDVAVESIVSR